MERFSLVVEISEMEPNAMSSRCGGALTSDPAPSFQSPKRQSLRSEYEEAAMPETLSLEFSMPPKKSLLVLLQIDLTVDPT
jgi:hypothetical protein